MEITFFACNETMGDVPPEACDAFRVWAAEQIEREYPGSQVTVSKEQRLHTVKVADLPDEDGAWRLEDDIELFCQTLWDRYWQIH